MTHDPREGLSPSARALLGRAAAPRPRTEEERRRTTRRVARLVVAPAVVGAWLSWKGALLAAALVAGAVGVVVARRPAPTPATPTIVRRAAPARSVSAPAPLPPAEQFGPPSPPPVVEAPRVEVARPARARVVPAAPGPMAETPAPALPTPAPVVASAPVGGPGSTAAPPVESEIQALERARSLLGSDPAGALRVVESLSHGTMNEERDLIALDALRRLGRVDALRTLGEQFLQRFPRSLYAERVRRWLRP